MELSQASRQILRAIQEARFLTVSQIARLFYAEKRDGNQPRIQVRRPRPTDVYELPPGWQSAYEQIKRMQKRGELKIVPYTLHGQQIRNIQRLIMLPKDKLSHQNWEHEITRGDCYVTLHNTGLLTGYRSRWSDGEKDDFAEQHGIYFDSHFDLKDNPATFFLEVDMGTEYWERELDLKVQDYSGLMLSMPQQPMYALFVTGVKENGLIASRLKSFGKCFKAHGRGQNFLVTPTELFLEDPLGAIWASERSTQPVSLTALP